MSTEAQLKEMLRPLREKRPDLVHGRRRLLIAPVEHVLRGVFFDHTLGKGTFIPWVFATTTWAIEGGFVFGYAIPLQHDSVKHWSVDDPIARTAIIEAIERTALPRLDPIDSLEAFKTFATSDDVKAWSRFGYVRDLVQLGYGVGDFETLDRAFAAYPGIPHSQETMELRWSSPAYNEQFDLMRPLVERRDKRAMATLLREWEFENAKRLKVEKHWRPAPFPALEG